MKVKGKRVYISGPMEGMPGLNAAAFHEAEGVVRERGARSVFNPARLGELGPGLGREALMREDIRALVSATFPIDLVVLLPGWEESRGAALEQNVAAQCGIEFCGYSEVE